MVVFLLPDGQAQFDLVNDITIGAKGLMPVTGRCAHPNSYFPNLQMALTVDGDRPMQAKVLLGLVENPAALFEG